MKPIAGLVLAGGRALRLGGVDKCLLPLGAGFVLDEVLARLRGQVAALAISANGDPARFAGFGLPVLADDMVGRGPLGGLLRGLEWAGAEGFEALLTVPGDTPFIPRDLVQRLGAAPAWALKTASLHPLVAVWPVSVRAELSAFLAGSGRVKAFGEAIGMRAVQFEDEPDPFLNINTPDDLARARGMA